MTNRQQRTELRDNPTLLRNRSKGFQLLHSIKKHWMLIAMVLPAVIWCAVFRYGPMYGLLIAFQRYRIGQPIASVDSRWVGFLQFQKFFDHPQFWQLLRNTLTISLLQIVIVFPIPIIFALLLNEVRNPHVKKLVQTVSYLPHFVSMVAVVSMLSLLLNPDTGIVNRILNFFGHESIYFLGKPEWYYPVYILSDIWQSFGFSSIIYISALSSVPQELYESASIDGASRFKQILHVSLPSILPTIIIMLILKCGGLLSVGYEKALLLQNSATNSVADIISTFTYRVGLVQANYSFGTAVDLFTSVINCILLFTVNKISSKVSDTALW